jgi:O-antigen/teichoic acid export membrane protein
MYLTDLAITLVLLPLMWPWMKPLLARRFSIDELRATLRFGLPRLPHGLASQTLDANPKLLLARHATAADVGVYQNGVTLGTGVAFFKNAFETAFAPFYYATAREPDAKVVFSKMATYGAAVFVLLVAGTVAVARDAILVLLDPSWLGALPVVPLVAIAFALQGVYQLTSIGLNLTNRTEFYSTATITAALVSVGAGWWLIPRYHVVGAAETVLVSYGTQVAMAFVMSQRMYPVHYEYGRVLRVVGAGVGAAAAGSWMLPASTPALAGLVLRGVLTIVVYAALLWISGFLRPTERAFLREIRARLARRPSSPRSAPARSDHDG